MDRCYHCEYILVYERHFKSWMICINHDWYFLDKKLVPMFKKVFTVVNKSYGYYHVVR